MIREYAVNCLIKWLRSTDRILCSLSRHNIKGPTVVALLKYSLRLIVNSVVWNILLHPLVIEMYLFNLKIVENIIVRRRKVTEDRTNKTKKETFDRSKFASKTFVCPKFDVDREVHSELFTPSPLWAEQSGTTLGAQYKTSRPSRFKLDFGQSRCFSFIFLRRCL